VIVFANILAFAVKNFAHALKKFVIALGNVAKYFVDF
jgi:hypothetical protein